MRPFTLDGTNLTSWNDYTAVNSPVYRSTGRDKDILFLLFFFFFFFFRDLSFISYAEITLFVHPYRPTSGGGADGKSPYVSFDRSLSQYLDVGAKTFRISTNGGFTAVAYVAFTGYFQCV